MYILFNKSIEGFIRKVSQLRINIISQYESLTYFLYRSQIIINQIAQDLETLYRYHKQLR